MGNKGYLLDTNAIIRHLSNDAKIGNKAKKLIIESENSSKYIPLYISVISLMEIMYLAEKKRIPLTLREMIKSIRSKVCYQIIDLDTEILLAAEKISFYELHDRLILGTASYLGVPILSSDREFKKVKEIKIIW